MAHNQNDLLREFTIKNNFCGKGPLSVALVVTQYARNTGLPLDAKRLVTAKEGQVRGLGRGAVQSILRRHGVSQVLAKEGGRTSRGSLNHMRVYVDFLNNLPSHGKVDLEAVEAFWVDRVRDFFAQKPFKIKLDASRSLRNVIRDVLHQAEERQKNSEGTHHAGAVLQHLVGAKLDLALGRGHFKHNSFSAADAPNNRSGDFLIGDVAIHVTTAPGEAVVERCRENLNDGLRAVIVTTQRGVEVADGLAANIGLSDRIDIFEIEQFVALNLYEFSKFAADARKPAIAGLISRYNAIIDECETDPSLKIELRT